MPLKLYMDVHIPRAITNGLRLRDVAVITAQEDGAAQLDDSYLLSRASQLGCVLYSQDDDLLIEAQRRQTSGETFAGVVYSHQLRSPVGRCIEDLELIATSQDIEQMLNQVEFIPF